MENNEIIVCRRSDGELIKCDTFAEAVKKSLEKAENGVGEIAITGVKNYKCITTRKIGRKGLLLHDILEDKNATDTEKEAARCELEALEQGIIDDSIKDIVEMEDGGADAGIDSVEVVYYLGACDNIYIKTKEYYENYLKRQGKL